MIEQFEKELLQLVRKLVLSLIGICILSISLITVMYVNAKAQYTPVINTAMCVVSAADATLIPAKHNSVTVLIQGNKQTCYIYREAA